MIQAVNEAPNLRSGVIFFRGKEIGEGPDRRLLSTPKTCLVFDGFEKHIMTMRERNINTSILNYH